MISGNYWGMGLSVCTKLINWQPGSMLLDWWSVEITSAMDSQSPQSTDQQNSTVLQDLKICVAKHFVYHKTVAHLGIHNIFFTSSVYRHLIFFYFSVVTKKFLNTLTSQMLFVSLYKVYTYKYISITLAIKKNCINVGGKKVLQNFSYKFKRRHHWINKNVPHHCCNTNKTNYCCNKNVPHHCCNYFFSIIIAKIL